ncbi:sigma factor, partial [Nocardia farcinica]|uniref:sigma factor n=1 Tax=Nocardia farcinica TaxID=37329 RepID=UPI0024542962
MAGPAVDAVYRAEFGRALATVARLVGDIAAAEDAVQEAFAEALRTWPARGTPANPGAWITTVARNPARDRVRRAAPPRPASPPGGGGGAAPPTRPRARLRATVVIQAPGLAGVPRAGQVR